MTYTITTTLRPDDEIVVSDAEYADLYALGLIGTATPGGVPPDEGDPAWLVTDDDVHFGQDVEVEQNLTVNGGITTGGRIVINQVDGSLSYPIGRTGSADTGLNILSSFAGGEDNGSGTDTTGRLNLYSFQRAQNGSFGETIRHFLMRADSKAMIAWYGPKAGYNVDESPNTAQGWQPYAWIGAHYVANDNASVHGHISIEVPDTTGAVQTRLEVPFIDQSNPPADGVTRGVDITNIATNLADFTVRAGSGVLRIGGSAAFNRDLLFSSSATRATAGERWKLRATAETEAGSNAGTNFAIRRHDDTGGLLGTAMFMRRSDGNTAFGGSAAEAARVAAVWSISGHHGFYARPTSTPGVGAAFAAAMTVSTDRLVDSRVLADGNARFVVVTDGQHEWGDGTASRDVNLYRSGVGILKTDQHVHVAGRLGISQAPDAAVKLGITQTTDTASILSVNSQSGGNTNQAHYRAESAGASGLMFASRVTGDAVSRYVVRVDGQMQWGDGTLARDVNLYRSAANFLATDDDFRLAVAGKGLRVAEGSNAKQGVATLVAGTVTVANTSVTANSRIFLTSQVDGGTPGWLRVSARVASTSFTITSSSNADTSTVAYQIFEPA